MEEWEARQQQLAEAERRGKLFADVSTLTRNLEHVQGSMKDISTVMSQISKEMVSKMDYGSLKTQVDDLSKWRWMIAGGLGLVVFIWQALPKLVDLLKRP